MTPEQFKKTYLKGNKGYKALGRLKSGVMNKTEQKYADLLSLKKQSGEVVEWWFDSINLKIGDNCHYRPDFLVMLSSGELEMHETKGYWTDDALVKIKVAAEKFPFTFRSFRYIKKEWEERTF